MKKIFELYSLPILFAAASVAVLLALMYSLSLTEFFVDITEHNIEQRLSETSKRLSAIVTAEELSLYREKADMKRPDYQALHRRLSDFAEETGVLYAYFLRVENGMAQYIVDSDLDRNTRVGLDTPTVDVKLLQDIAPALEGRATVSTMGRYESGWEGLLTGYAPIFGSNGEVVAVCGVDINDEAIVNARKRVQTLWLMEATAFFAVFFSGVFSFRKYRSEAGLARSASEAKSRFLSNMSHEIRTPMNAVIGLSEMGLRMESLPSQAVENFSGIKRAGQNLLSLINDILDFSKIESGKLEIVSSLYTLSSLLNDAVSVIQVRLAEKPQRQIQFTVDIEPTLPNNLIGDETRVKQVLLNMLSNAVKYTFGGFIKFSVTGKRTDENSVLLKFVVADSGIGIKSEDTEKLFGDFVRLDPARNKGVEGTGLGLAIVKKLCLAMRGDINVESVYGEGSVFTATLLQEFSGCDTITAYKPQTRGVEKYEAQFVAPDARVLLVDDMPSNIIVAKGLMEPYMVKTDECENGIEAVELVRKNAYDMVLMDHMMPGMDGVEATAAIRSLGEDFGKLPIIALTANAVSGMREMFLQHGLDDFLSKPIDPAKLDSILHKWIPVEKQSIPQAKHVRAEVVLEAPGFVIDGVDVVKGINMCGGEVSYRKVLRQYCRDADKRIEYLTLSHAERDLKDFVNQVHALKSVLAGIGAQELSEVSALLEDAGKRGDAATIAERVDGYRERLSSVTESIRGALDAHGAGDKRQGRVQLPGDVTLQLQGLKEALEAEKIGAVKKMLTELSAMSLDPQLSDAVSEISDLVLVAEFDKAAALVSALGAHVAYGAGGDYSAGGGLDYSTADPRAVSGHP